MRVSPIIRRHIDDVAFYWQQLDTPFPGADFDADKAAHFLELMEAHQEGIRVAEDAAVAIAIEALERWRKAGEAYAATYAAIHLKDADKREGAMNRILRVIRRHPDVMLRGAISAIAAGPAAHVDAWLAQALLATDDVILTLALRASALLGDRIVDSSRFAKHTNASVRAAARRTLPVFPVGDEFDENSVVRAEAVISWARHTPHRHRDKALVDAAARMLGREVIEQADRTIAAAGWNRLQAERRLERWLRFLAWIVPPGHPGTASLLEKLPRRQALSFVLHHGDPRHLGFVVGCMSDPSVARWAGWVWQGMTGVELASEGLALGEKPIDLDDVLTAPQQDADLGLPRPDASRVARHAASFVSSDERIFLGGPVTAHALREILDPESNRPQALRLVAAHALAQMHPEYTLNLRGSANLQRAQLRRMGIQLAPQSRERPDLRDGVELGSAV